MDTVSHVGDLRAGGVDVVVVVVADEDTRIVGAGDASAASRARQGWGVAGASVSIEVLNALFDVNAVGRAPVLLYY